MMQIISWRCQNTAISHSSLFNLDRSYKLELVPVAVTRGMSKDSVMLYWQYVLCVQILGQTCENYLLYLGLVFW